MKFKTTSLDILSNSFLSPQQQELQKLAYYGKFLVLPSFDDGWKYQMQQQLLDYLSSLDFGEEKKKINLRVEKETNNNKGEIFAILKSKSLTPETEEKILKISTLLQKRFSMTSVQQRIGFGASENTVLPVKLEGLTEKDFGYERQKFQEQYANILMLEQKLKDISYYIDKKNSIGDELSSILVNELKQLKNNYSEELKIFQKSLSEVNKNLYDSLAVKTILGDKKDMYNIVSSKTNNTSKTETDGENKRQAVNTKKYSHGKILAETIDKDGDLIYAKSVETGEIIEYNGKYIIGLNIDGFPYIDKLRVLEINDKHEILLFFIEFEKSKFYFYFKDGKYKKFSIKGENIISGLSDYTINKSGKPLYGRIYLGSFSNETRFWIENGEYKSLKLKGVNAIEYFKNLKLDKNGKPLSGYFHTGNYEYKYFWLEEGEYKILKIEGYGQLRGISNLVCEKDGKPLYGKFRNDFDWKVKFILDKKTGKYIKKKIFMKNPYK